MTAKKKKKVWIGWVTPWIIEDIYEHFRKLQSWEMTKNKSEEDDKKIRITVEEL